MANNPIFHSQYTAQQIENEITNGVPKIVDGYWWRWDIATGTWVNTGDSAEGAEAWHGIAEEFSTSADYAVGDLCIYNGELYVCKTAHSGAWDASNFAVTTIDAQKASTEVALGAYPTESSSGATAETNVGADNIPLKTLVADIVAVQDGEGVPSPDNVRDISGYTGLTITHGENEIPISWESEAGEVFGGTLDVLTGVLTVNWVSETYTSVIAVVTSSGKVMWKVHAENQTPITKAYTETISNIFGSREFANGHTYTGASKALYLIPHDQTMNTKAQADTWLAANPTQVVFEIETPVTYQLSPIAVASVLGANSISSDIGNVSVAFRCDPNLYIAAQIGGAITDAIGGAY